MTVPDGERSASARTLRPPSSAAAFVAVVIMAAFFVGDAAVRGSWAFLVRWLPLILLVVWAFWLVLWRSSVRADRTGVVVVNLARVHELPWSRVTEIQQRAQLRFVLDDGRRVECWGGPFPSRGRIRPDSARPDLVGLLEATRESAQPDDRPATHRWDVPALVAGGVLTLLSIVCAAIVRT